MLTVAVESCSSGGNGVHLGILASSEVDSSAATKRNAAFMSVPYYCLQAADFDLSLQTPRSSKSHTSWQRPPKQTDMTCSCFCTTSTDTTPCASSAMPCAYCTTGCCSAFWLPSSAFRAVPAAFCKLYFALWLMSGAPSGLKELVPASSCTACRMLCKATGPLSN